MLIEMRNESSLGAQSFCWFCHEAAHMSVEKKKPYWAYVTEYWTKNNVSMSMSLSMTKHVFFKDTTCFKHPLSRNASNRLCVSKCTAQYYIRSLHTCTTRLPRTCLYGPTLRQAIRSTHTHMHAHMHMHARVRAGCIHVHVKFSLYSFILFIKSNYKTRKHADLA